MKYKIIEQQIDQKHKDAFIIVQYFFSGFNILSILFLLFLSKFNFKKYIKLLCLMILDIILRFLKLTKYYVDKSLKSQILFSFISSIEFFLIISIINKVFKNANVYKKDRSKICQRILLTIIYCFIIFPYNKFILKYGKYLFISNIIINLIFINILNYYLKVKLKVFFKKIKEKEERNRFIFIIIDLLPNLISISFSLYYFGKFLYFYIENKLYISYLGAILITIKEIGKYSIYLFLGCLLYLFEKDNSEFKKVKNEKYNLYNNKDVLFFEV